MLLRIAMAASLLAAGITIATPNLAVAQGFLAPGTVGGGGQALYWTRSDLQSTNGGTALLSTDNLNLDWEVGAEFWLGWQDSCSCWGADLRYFWIEPYESEAGASLTLPMGIGDTMTTVNVGLGFESFLQGAELSATYQATESLSLLGGFRWIQLDEALTQTLEIPAIPAELVGRNGAINNLYGAQVGANARVFNLPNFATNLIGKAGIYGNAKEASISTTGTGIPPAFQSDSSGCVAFATDARIQSELWLTPLISISGGYQVLYLDGVLRGETNFLTAGPLTATHRDSLLYHGAFLGLNIRR